MTTRPLLLLKHVMSKKPWLPKLPEDGWKMMLHDFVSDLRDTEKLDMIRQIAKMVSVNEI